MTDGWLVIIFVLVAIFWCRDEDGSFAIERVLFAVILILGLVIIWPAIRAWM